MANPVCGRIKDLILEARIWWAWECFNAAVSSNERRLFAEHAASLQRLRSASQVARMEQRMGLR